MQGDEYILPYLEFHLTDHCNMNCKGCTHFCPIAEENYLTLESYVKDIKRLSEIFTNILRIRIMGGEPLLHPLVSEFVKVTRQFFPISVISVVTNGILLPTMTSDFYETMKKNNICLDISAYPIIIDDLPVKTVYAAQYGIVMTWREITGFCKFIDTSGTIDGNKSFAECWANDCTFLRNGKIYVCCLPALSYIANKRFGWNIPSDGFIDIHQNVSARDILDFLKRPSPACSYCYGYGSNATWFSWSVSKREPHEWLRD